MGYDSGMKISTLIKAIAIGLIPLTLVNFLTDWDLHFVGISGIVGGAWYIRNRFHKLEGE